MTLKFKALNINWIIFLSLLVIFSFCGILFIATQEVLAARKDVLKSLAQLRLNEEKAQIEFSLQKDLNTLTRIKKLIEQFKSRNSFVLEIANHVISTNSELLAIAWIDSKFNINPLSGNDQLLQSIIPKIDMQSKFNENHSKNKPLFIYHQIKGYHPLLLIFYPLYWNNIFEGYLISSLDLQMLLEQHFELTHDRYYNISISHDNKVFFEINTTSTSVPNEWHFNAQVIFDSFSLSLELSPTNDFLSLMLGHKLLLTIFFFGVILAFAFGGLFFLWQLSRKQLASLAQTKDELDKSQQKLTSSLKAASIGTWSWDAKTNTLSLDPLAHALFGLEPGQFSGDFKDILKKTHPADQFRLEQQINAIITTGKPGTVEIAGRVLFPNNAIHYLTLKANFTYEKDISVAKANGIILDETPIKQAYQMLEISEALTRILSDSQTLQEAASKTINILNIHFGWDTLVVWEKEEHLKTVECKAIAHANNISRPMFDLATVHLQENDHCLFYKALNSYKYIAVQDVNQLADFLRKEAALKEGIKGALAFPIYRGVHLTGAIELFRQSEYNNQGSDEFFRLISLIGTSIQDFIDRMMTLEAKTELAIAATYASDGLFTIDSDFKIKTWNKGAEKIFGWSEEEILGSPINRLLPPNDQKDLEILHNVMKFEMNIPHFEVQRVRKDGSLIWVSNAISHTKKDNILAVVIVHDITTQKKIIEDLVKSEEKFRIFVETSEEWIWEMDAHRIFSYSSSGLKKILGYSPEEILNKDMLDFLFEDNKRTAAKQVQSYIDKKKGWVKQERRWRHKNGSERWLESNAEPIFDNHNEFAGFRGSDRDITEGKLVEKSKNEFISSINHELRTPLTSMHGALGLLLHKNNFKEDDKQLIEIAQRNTIHLINIVNDLLDIQKFLLGKFQTLTEAVSLNAVIEEAIQMTMPLAKQLPIEILYDNKTEKVIVQANHTRLVQVMNNLLSNAIKFSPPNSKIYIDMQKIGNLAKVSVKDQGIGIPKNFRPKIFDRFARADNIDARNAPGTGLGLSITKNIIEFFKGKIYFESEEGVGTTFFIELPL